MHTHLEKYWHAQVIESACKSIIDGKPAGSDPVKAFFTKSFDEVHQNHFARFSRLVFAQPLNLGLLIISNAPLPYLLLFRLTQISQIMTKD